MPNPDFPDPASSNPLAAECLRCPALVAARERICWGVGPRDASVVVVGEAPAAGEPDADRWQGGNWTGMAYTGRHSGRKIREMCEQLSLEEAYFTNAVKCFPSAAIEPVETGRENAGGTDGIDRIDEADETDNREPTAEERANCRPYLRREIEEVDPACVLATGGHATRSLLAVENRTVESFLDLILEVQDCPTLEVPVLPVLHPSYQEVWISRLGYSYGGYVEAVRQELRALGALR